MDIQFQDLGDCPIQNLSHDLQAGDFAQSLPSSVEELGAAIQTSQDSLELMILALIPFTDSHLDCIKSVAQSLGYCSLSAGKLACDFVGCAHHPASTASLVFSNDVCDFTTCKLSAVA